MTKTSWSELSPAKKKAVYAVGAVEAVMAAAALWDLAHRPAAQVRGPKAAWAMTAFVQPFGPVAYFVLGRRQDRQDPA